MSEPVRYFRTHKSAYAGILNRLLLDSFLHNIQCKRNFGVKPGVYDDLPLHTVDPGEKGFSDVLENDRIIFLVENLVSHAVKQSV